VVTYDSEFDYIASATSDKDKIAKMQAIINVLEETALKAATSQNIDEYWLDDGQTKIKTVYRGMKEIMAGTTAIDTLMQRYINRLQGRVVRLVDEKNFRHGGI